MKRFFASAMVAALVGGFGATAGAETRELRYATNAPEISPWGEILKTYAERLEEISGGELTVKMFFGGKLGDEQELTRMIVRGRLDIASVSATGVAQAVPEMALLSLPFGFASDEQRFCVEDNHMDAVLGDLMSEAGIVALGVHMDAVLGDLMSEAGIVALGVAETGHEIIFAQSDLSSPSDLAGVKLRTPTNRSAVGYFESLNASIVPSGVQDIVPGLQTGGLEAAVTATIFGFAMGVHELAPTIILTEHVGSAGNTIISKRIWDGLSEEEQGWLIEAQKVTLDMRGIVHGFEETIINQAGELGATVVHLTDEQRAEWVAAAEAARADLIEGVSPKAQMIWERLETAKAACQ